MHNPGKTLFIVPVIMYFLYSANEAFAFLGNVFNIRNSIYENAIELIFGGFIVLFVFLFLLDNILDGRRKKSYSRFQDDFGEDFTGSSGGVPFGDGFKGLNRK